MATPTLSTSISRRTMLVGSALVPAVAFPLLTALAALPEPAFAGTDLSTDAELLRCIAAAEHLRNRYARARRLRDRIRETRRARGDFRPLPRRGPIPPCDIDAYLHYADLFRRYANAVRAAIAVPAYTVAGIHAKLALGVIAARRGDARVYMYEDREWLEVALADLKRLALNVPTTK